MVSAVPTSCSSYLALRAMVGRRGMQLALARRLRAVLAATLAAVTHARRVERATHDVVLDGRQVAHLAAAHEHHRVLLQVVPDAGNVGGDLHPVDQPDARDLAKGRVRLLRGARHDLQADTTTLRRAATHGAGLLQGVQRAAERGRLDLLACRLAALTDQLADGWQR